MLEPKIFYRKLDFLLAKINHSNTGKDYLFTIVNELIDTFGEDLHLKYGRIYQESENEYFLMTPDNTKSIAKKVLSKEDETVKVLKTKAISTMIQIFQSTQHIISLRNIQSPQQ